MKITPTKEINKTIEQLRALWHKYPQLRLSQLILNAIDTETAYYLEDQEFIDAIDDHYKMYYGE